MHFLKWLYQSLSPQNGSSFSRTSADHWVSKIPSKLLSHEQTIQRLWGEERSGGGGQRVCGRFDLKFDLKVKPKQRALCICKMGGYVLCGLSTPLFFFQEMGVGTRERESFRWQRKGLTIGEKGDVTLISALPFFWNVSTWRIKRRRVTTYLASDIFVSPIYFLTDK